MPGSSASSAAPTGSPPPPPGASRWRPPSWPHSWPASTSTRHAAAPATPDPLDLLRIL